MVSAIKRFSASMVPCRLPPAREIDDRVAGGDEDVAGAHYIRAAEEDETIAVGMGRRLMQHLDAFAVEVQVLFVGERVGGPGAGGIGSLIAILRAHPIEQSLMRDHRRALARIGDIARDVAAHDGAAEARDFLVAAGVIRMHVRVDHVADRSIGDLADGSDHFVASCSADRYPPPARPLGPLAT